MIGKIYVLLDLLSLNTYVLYFSRKKTHCVLLHVMSKTPYTSNTKLAYHVAAISNLFSIFPNNIFCSALFPQKHIFRIEENYIDTIFVIYQCFLRIIAMEESICRSILIHSSFDVKTNYRSKILSRCSFKYWAEEMNVWLYKSLICFYLT